MKIWLLDYHPAHNHVAFVDRDRYKAVEKIVSQGGSLLPEWTPLTVELKDVGQPADFLGRVGGALVISQKTKARFASIASIAEHAEFLPLHCRNKPDEELYLMHTCVILNCIDANESKVKMFPSGKVMEYEEYSLYEDRVSGHDLFRISYHDGDTIIGYLFVSDRIQTLIENELDGFQLIELWDSEFSWRDKLKKHSVLSDEIDRSLVETFDFSKAVKYVQRHKGHEVYSGQWALRVDSDNDIQVGHLHYDGTYSWTNPIYYPPVLLDLTWGITVKRSFLDRVKDGFSLR